MVVVALVVVFETGMATAIDGRVCRKKKRKAKMKMEKCRRCNFAVVVVVVDTVTDWRVAWIGFVSVVMMELITLIRGCEQ